MLTELPKPKTDLAEILYHLIKKPEISERMFSQNGFRSRLTDLRNLGLNLRDQWKEFRKRNKKCQHKVHYLWRSELPKAIRLYEKINRA